MAQMFNPFMWQQMPPGQSRGTGNQNGMMQGAFGAPGGMPGFGMNPGGRPAPFPTPGADAGRNNQTQKPASRTPSNPAADAIRRQKEENARFLDPSRYKETNISQSDLSEIVAMYGNDIENIYDLSPGQRWMFDRGHTEKKAQIMQFVFRARMEFDAPGFRQRVYALHNRHDNFRTAFAYRNLEHPYKVVLKSRAVRYFLLDSTDMLKSDDEASVNAFVNKLLDEDRQRGFDLENDPLVRIGVYKLKEDDYVFLISQPHINTDGASLGVLIKELFMDYALELNGIDMPSAESSYKEYAKYMLGVDKDKQLEYWKNKLEGYTGECHLPGFSPNNGNYTESEYVFDIDETDFNKINGMQSGLKASLFNILQAAWAVSLCQITGKKDVLFGIIISGRHADVKDSMHTLGGFAELVPIRVEIGDDDDFETIVGKVKQSTSDAEKNSDCTIQEIENHIGREVPLVTHDLNFHNFEMPKLDMFKNGGLKGFEMVSGSMHISHLENLSLVFSKSDNKLVCDFHYNLNTYLPYSVMITAKHFGDVLKAVAEGGSGLKLSDFPQPDNELFDVAQDAYELSNMRKVMAMKKLELFESIDIDELFEIAKESDVVGYKAGIVVFVPEDALVSIPVLTYGSVKVHSGDDMGWQKAYGELSGQGIITCSALIGDKAEIAVTAAEDNTSILYIPRNVFEKMLKSHADLALKLAVIMERQGRE